MSIKVNGKLLEQGWQTCGGAQAGRSRFEIALNMADNLINSKNSQPTPGARSDDFESGS